MLTIALDEAGSFDSGMKEGSFRGSRTTLIGGIAFDDKNAEDEVANERRRIEAYYKRVMKAVKDSSGADVQFPVDLHKDPKSDNRKKEGAVKSRVADTIAEFIREGTYEGQPLKWKNAVLPDRKGAYYICAVVRSSRGKSRLKQTDLGEFFRDGCASNVYFHMVSETVEHFIFHNPLCPKEEHFRLDIATRESNDISDKKSRELYREQGFENQAKSREEKKTSSSTSLGEALSKAGYTFSEPDHPEHYQLMNADIFRTILTEQMRSCDRKKIQIDSFYVAPIKYEYEKDGDKNKLAHEDQVFLYLADSICAYLTYQIGDDDTAEVLRRAEELAGERTLVFAYDEADERLKNALRALELDKYNDALKETYRILAAGTSEAKIYKEKWIPFIENKIIAMVKEDRRSRERTSPVFEAVLGLGNDYLSNRVNTGEAFYVFKVLEKACGDFDDRYGYDEINYYLNSIGLSAYCHKGEPKKAEEYFERCMKYAGAVKLEDHINTRNQYATALGDMFQYEKAVEMIEGTIGLTQGLVELSKKTLGSQRELFGLQDMGRSYSQAGQFAAFLGDSESAEMYFNKAIESFGENKESIKRTDSYRLHALIDAGEKEEYVRGMVRYTERFGLREQLAYIQEIADDGFLKIEYALYLYLKGLYNFVDPEELRLVWKDITAYIDSLKRSDRNGHPWEMIYKYLCLIALRVEDVQAEERYENLLKQFFMGLAENKESALLQIITQSNLACIYGVKKDDEREMKLYSKAYKLLAKNFPMAVEGEDGSDDQGKKKTIIKKLRYMYC
ncbi:MAG: tetratricopeptide repeat protein [Lachnospiraceae bacterium]|nr:tetratricopeptide repeat protein [Lachnospiraceae bacterium]